MSRGSTKRPPPPRFCGLPGFKATSCLTIVMLICLETVLLSTVSNCAKTFYMHWNTSNSIFRIDNTDHIIDVNKGNLAFEFDQVHIICPVYEPGTFDNETEKYIIYNVSKVEYETCRITNADPRVIAICDKPQKLMFFTITFRPFTPQPGGLEFLPGNDYYFISTSSKDDLYRRIGGRCSTDNMKVVFKVCCAPEDKNNQTIQNGNGSTSSSSSTAGNTGGGGSGQNIGGGGGGQQQQQQHSNNINIIGNGGGGVAGGGGGGGMGHLSPSSPSSSSSNGAGGSTSVSSSTGISINTNNDQFNRIPVFQNQPINGGGRINPNIPPNMGMNNIGTGPGGGGGIGGGMGSNYMPPMTSVNTNNSNVVQSTMSWPGWGRNNALNIGNNGEAGGHMPQQPPHGSTPISTLGGSGIGLHPQFYPPPHMTSPRPNINSAINNNSNFYSPSHNNKSPKKTNEYDKHPNEVVKNEELTYNSGASSSSKLFLSSTSTISVSFYYKYLNNKANSLFFLLDNNIKYYYYQYYCYYYNNKSSKSNNNNNYNNNYHHHHYHQQHHNNNNNKYNNNNHNNCNINKNNNNNNNYYYYYKSVLSEAWLTISSFFIKILMYFINNFVFILNFNYPTIILITLLVTLINLFKYSIYGNLSYCCWCHR